MISRRSAVMAFSLAIFAALACGGGTTSAPTPTPAPAPEPPAIAVGTEVAAPWGDVEGSLWLATVSSGEGDAIHVTYSDGTEADVSASACTVLEAREWSEGDNVRAAWSSGGFWDGTIQSVNGDGTYDILWEDGTVQEATPANRIIEGANGTGESAPSEAATNPAPGISIESETVSPGDAVTITLDEPAAPAHGEEYWVTIAKASDPDSEWGTWAMVPAGATSVELTAPAEVGDYEVRIHDQYPAQNFHVAHRVSLTIE